MWRTAFSTFAGTTLFLSAAGRGDLADEVRNAFGRYEVEVLSRPNSRQLRENATFLALLERIADPDLHTARSTHTPKDVLCLGDPLGSCYWRNAIYHELLDDWERNAELLDVYPIVGTHRRFILPHCDR